MNEKWKQWMLNVLVLAAGLFIIFGGQNTFDAVRFRCAIVFVGPTILTVPLVAFARRKQPGVMFAEVIMTALIPMGVLWLLYGGYGVMDRVLYPGRTIFKDAPESSVLFAISVGGFLTAWAIATGIGVVLRRQRSKNHSTGSKESTR